MDNRKIFVGNLDFNVTENELKTLLAKWGTVVSVKLYQKKGYSFAEMGSAEEASEVVKNIDGLNFKNREIRASLLMKKNKAKSAVTKRFREKGAAFTAKKRADESAAKERNEKSRGSLRSKPGGRGEAFSPSYGKPKTGFNKGKRFSSNDERSTEGRESRGHDYAFTRDSLKDEGSQRSRPERKGWTGKPAYSSKSSRYGQDAGEEYKEDFGRGYKRKNTLSGEQYPGGFKKDRRGASGPPVKAWTSVKGERFKKNDKAPETGEGDRQKSHGNRGGGSSGGGYSGLSSGKRKPSAPEKKGTGRRNASNPSGGKSGGSGSTRPGGRQGRG